MSKSLVVGLLWVLTLAGCASASDEPTEPATSEGPSAGSPCDVITSEELSEWTGRSTRVVGPETDEQAGRTQCKEELDPPATLNVRWAFDQAQAPVQDLAADQADILENSTTEEIELEGGFAASIVEGDLVGELPTVELVTVLDGERLIVTVTEALDPDPDTMRSIATRVAQRYADGATESGEPSQRTPTATAPCDVVSDEALSSWTSTSQVVTGPTQVGSIQKCATVRDPDDGLVATWTVEDADGTYADLVEKENFGDEGASTRIDLTGKVPATVLETTALDEDLVRVVTVVDDEAIVVEVQEFSFRADPVPPGLLRSVAIEIADAYAAAR